MYILRLRYYNMYVYYSDAVYVKSTLFGRSPTITIQLARSGGEVGKQSDSIKLGFLDSSFILLDQSDSYQVTK